MHMIVVEDLEMAFASEAKRTVSYSAIMSSRFHFPFGPFRSPRPILPQLIKTSVTTLKLLCAVHLLTTTLVELRLCSGLSMLPTLSPHGDFVLLSPLSLLLGHSPKRGDVVVATSPMDPRRTVCKRVLALEGDIIQVDPRGRDRKTWKALADIETPAEPTTEPSVGIELRDRDSEGRPLVSGGQRGAGQYVKIPKGHVWLQGDNLSNSTDSRAYGPVPMALLKGTVLARVYPNFTWLSNPMRTLGEGEQKNV